MRKRDWMGRLSRINKKSKWKWSSVKEKHGEEWSMILRLCLYGLGWEWFRIEE